MLQPTRYRVESERSTPKQELGSFIRTCLPRKEECLKDDYTGFHVWFLGTGGSTPSKSRMTSATILQLGGQSLLFDVGEGFQRQLYYTRQRFTDLSKIFITHMHGDHILGLPGLLLMAQAAGRDRKYTQKIDIYGPPGLYNYIVANMMLMRATTNASEICIHELVGGTADGQLKRRMPKENIIHGDFPNLFKHKNIERKTIEPNEDGTWTIEREQEKFEDDDDVDFRRGRNRKFNIYAAEVTHINAVQTFGYTVSEPEPMRKIDAEKATKLGVAPSKKYKKLKNGFPVTSDDGLRTIQPEQVLTTTNRKQRKIAVIGDNCGLSPAMEKLCRNADVMVHEASLSIESTIDAKEKGHSSAGMAGKAARNVNASVLALNHISARVGVEKEVSDLVYKVEETNGGISHVIPSFDFMELIVPRFGFPPVEHHDDWQVLELPQYSSDFSS